jgi:hypothetical protein
VNSDWPMRIAVGAATSRAMVTGRAVSASTDVAGVQRDLCPCNLGHVPINPVRDTTKATSALLS